MTITTTTTPRAQILTSLAEIKFFKPCASGWGDILTGQKKTTADDVQFPIVDCLDSNSVSDVFWLFRKLANSEQAQIFVTAARLFAESAAEYKNKSAAYAAYAAYAAAAAAAAAVAAAAHAAAAAATRAAAYAAYAADANVATRAVAAAAHAAAAVATRAVAAAYAAAAHAADAAATRAIAAAADAADAADADADAADAADAQKEKNKQILRNCILDWEAGAI